MNAKWLGGAAPLHQTDATWRPSAAPNTPSEFIGTRAQRLLLVPCTDRDVDSAPKQVIDIAAVEMVAVATGKKSHVGSGL